MMQPAPNPYAPPASPYDAGYAAPTHGSLQSTAIADALRKTRPWVSFLGIMGFIGSGFMVLGSLGVFAAAKEQPMMAPVGVVYLLLSAFYIYPSLLLLRYGSSISTFLQLGHTPALETALESQARFWRFAGILTVVTIVGGILAALAIGGVAAYMAASTAAELAK